MSRVKLSVCLIVRNEQRLLPDCLRSVQEAADEIIVVDTGSTDETISIAKQAGAFIVEMHWQDDFSAARNCSLSHASGKWILILDADERLAADSVPLLRNLVEGEDPYEGYFLRVEHVMEEETNALPLTVNPLLRLFRNRDAYRFEGAIHEQIAPVILRERSDAKFAFTPIRVLHVGYQPHIVSGKDKIARNVQMIERAIATEGRQPFHLFNLAVERLRQGNAEEALSVIREARSKTPRNASFTHLMVKMEAWACAGLGRLEEAIQVCAAGIKDFPDYTDLHFALAVYYDASGNRRAAAEAMREAVRIGTPPSHYHTEGGVGTFRAQLQLGAWALEARAWADADRAFNAALAEAGCPATAWLASVRLRRALNIAPALSEPAAQWLLAQTPAQRSALLRAASHGSGAPLGIAEAAKLPQPSEVASPTDEATSPASLALAALHEADATLTRLQQLPQAAASALTLRLCLPLYALALSTQTKEVLTE